MSYYRRHVFFCTNQRDDGRQCCAQADAAKMRDYLKQRVQELGLAGPGGIRVNTAGCLGRCAEGPTIVVYPEGIWYSYQTTQDLDEILRTHLQDGQVVERLRLGG